MKEIKYESVEGLESQNTFSQFDQFEVSDPRSAKNRYIYDFSYSAKNLKTEDSILNTSVNTTSAQAEQAYKNSLSKDGLSGNQSVWMIKNFNNSLTSASYSNLSTDKRPILIGEPLLDNPYSPLSSTGTQYTSDFSMVSDNTESAIVPNIQENALVYLNALGNHNLETSFRSGYIELSFKTTKSNCVIAYGTSLIDVVDGTTTFTVQNQTTTYGPIALGNDPSKGISLVEHKSTTSEIDDPYYITEEDYAYINSLSINVKNGTLNITHEKNNKTYELNGNQQIDDNKWHHVVINFGRPGLLKELDTKFNNKSIEFWIDGKLDKRSYDYINDSQVFFPEINWLCANPVKLYKADTRVFAGIWSSSALNDAFNGSIRTFAHGINFPLDKYEIQTRYKLWTGNESATRDSATANAQLVNPTISVNKKKALKLFWNNITNKNGVELDNKFIVDSYSVTHKNANSPTETYNLDLANAKDYNILNDVRAVFKDHVLIWGPSKVSVQNKPDIQSASIGQTRSTSTNQGDGNVLSEFNGFEGPILDLKFSGIELNNQDRILLSNQINPKDNGIWQFNGKSTPLSRPTDVDSPKKIKNGIVYVTEGYYAETYWMLEKNISSFTRPQSWIQLENKPETTVWSQPFLTTRWSDATGKERFINFQQDIDVNKYDLIVFMNYPETNEEIKANFVNESDFYVQTKYEEFTGSLLSAVENGSSLHISSPKLATDLKIVKKFTEVPQLLENADGQSASISPFEVSEPASRYFDTHRNNKYHLATTVQGLTNKTTYTLTDFINYVPENEYDYEQYHAKYSYRQFGLQEEDEFFIPGLTLRSITENSDLPGYLDNQKGTNNIFAINPQDILGGTTVTKLANNYYNGSSIVSNPYDDFVTTLIIQPNTQLNGQTVLGKIFINCVEDGYTFSREDYNKASVQIIPGNDTNETTSTRSWQYSTTRLNRLPKRINVKELTKFGQTTPTNGGGGPLIQAPSNSSNGTIRSATDKNNINYQSDLYPTEVEEKYTIDQIPVLSMTWLGLLWLAD